MLSDILKKIEKRRYGVGDNERPETIRSSIRKGETMLGMAHREIDDMDRDELKRYLGKLRDKWTGSGDGVAGKLPDEVTTADDTLPHDIRALLSHVAVKYEVTPEQIYDRYLQLRDELEEYPIEDFRVVLQAASKGSLCFKNGFIREIKLNYADKITYDPDHMTIFKLTAGNSRDDIIIEIHKAEAVCCELGNKYVLTRRAKTLGVTKLDKVSKQALLQYLWILSDEINAKSRVRKILRNSKGRFRRNI